MKVVGRGAGGEEQAVDVEGVALSDDAPTVRVDRLAVGVRKNYARSQGAGEDPDRT